LLEGREGSPGTLFTIHNLAFQGLFPPDVLPRLGVAPELFQVDGIEFWGSVSLLKAGIRYADRLTTVSPTYAREILSPEHGCGLDGLLRVRAGRLSGILNGVDRGIWDPATDELLPARYEPGNLAGKMPCKAALQRELGLAEDSFLPLIVSASRLTHQKMADIVAEVAPTIVALGAQLAILGEGDRSLCATLQAAAATQPRRIACRIGYEEGLAHRLFAGGDILLAPARFEPCGLTPIYGMLYGTPPVVRRTGGTVDTVVDATPDTIRAGTATGFTFAEPNDEDLLACLCWSLALLREPVLWHRLVRCGMSRPFGWNSPAQAYAAFYDEIATDRALQRVGAVERVRAAAAARLHDDRAA
jgi:starch synthase